MKYYIIAGEASGDLHGAHLIKALAKQDGDADVRCWGGDLMEAAGAKLQKHYRDLAFMGFVEVAKNIRTILRNFRICKADILAYQPDALILIDYPGFNLRMAKWAKEQGIPVHYYISPQVWAWHSSRVHQIKANVDHMYVILPFEEAFYAEYDMKVHYVGHPLIDVVDEHQTKLAKNHPEERLVALLPGSRKQEIERMLSVMLEAAKSFPACRFVIAGAPARSLSYYEDLLATYGQPANVEVVSGKTYDLLRSADAALVTSGTATLETALFGVPQIVCYRGNPLSYWIARRLVNVKYISLVNLIVDYPLVEELIQDDLSPEKLSLALRELLSEPKSSSMKAAYKDMRIKLGESGAADRCASLIQKAMGQ